MYRVAAFIFIFIFSTLNANNSFKDARIEEQKKELEVLKGEFDSYYTSQEKELKDRLNEIELKEMLVKKREKNIENLLSQNGELLKEIKMEVISKNIKVYNSMKAKNIAAIFEQMISEHNIQKVYDIMIKLKSANIVKIMQKMSKKNASLLTQLMLNGKKPEIRK